MLIFANRVRVIRPEAFHYVALGFVVWLLVACRSEFVTADAAGGVGVFPLDGASIGGVGKSLLRK